MKTILSGFRLRTAAYFTLAVAQAALAQVTAGEGTPPRDSATAVQSASADELQRQMLELQHLMERQNARLDQQAAKIEQQNKTIETLRKKLDSKEPLQSMPAIVATSSTRGVAADSVVTEEELDARISVAIANMQAKADQAGTKTFEVGKDLGMNASWQHGLWVETADKAFRFHVGGRAQADAVWMNGDSDVQFGPGGTGQIDDGVNYRRARLAAEGTIYEVIDFVTEYDFINSVNSPAPGANTPVPTDVYATITHLPVLGNFRIGNQKPPISFEHLTSSRFLDFMERSYLFDAFVGGLDNGFRPGMMLFNTACDDRMSWAIGIFKNNNRPFGWNSGDGEDDLTGRLTFLPYYSDDGRCLIHLGLGASHRDLDDGEARFRTRTLLRNGPGHLQTVLGEARMEGDTEDLIVPELVVVSGPWTFQTEYFAAWVDGVDRRITPGPAAAVPSGTYFADGFYMQALYFLTGENRVYDKKYPRFSRVVPNENYFCVEGDDGCRISGHGAWQVGVRYSHINLNDHDINGGDLDDITVGLNWFLNPNMKIQWNYTWDWRDAAGDTSDGTVQGFGMRLALDF